MATATATSNPTRMACARSRALRVAGASSFPFPRIEGRRAANAYSSLEPRAYAFTISRTSRCRMTSASVK